jgi:hypothetical protein
MASEPAAVWWGYERIDVFAEGAGGGSRSAESSPQTMIVPEPDPEGWYESDTLTLRPTLTNNREPGPMRLKDLPWLGLNPTCSKHEPMGRVAEKDWSRCLTCYIGCEWDRNKEAVGA